MDQNSEVLEKIKKLLRLGTSANQHEAELALQRAFELARRHNIDLASVDVDDQTRRILHKAFGLGQRTSLLHKLAIRVVHNHFNVSAIMSNYFHPNLLCVANRVIFVGTETDIEIAWYVVDFLVSACRKSLRQFQKESPRKLTPNKRRGFIAGFFYGVSSKLRLSENQLQIEGPNNALITNEEARREKYQDENFDTKPIDLKLGKQNPAALHEGWMAGRDTQINPGLGAASRLRISEKSSSL